MPLVICRYPGGKNKSKSQILDRVSSYFDNNRYDIEYREPFFGAGSVGLSLLESRSQIKNIWINDYDPAIAALWNAILFNPKDLSDMVDDFKPDVDKFFAYKEELLKMGREVNDVVSIGFKKLAIHQISYSGLGAMSGGPLGGKHQTSSYDISCRWSPSHIRKMIRDIHSLLSSKNLRYGKCTSFDFMDLMKQDGECFLYLDPPYYEKGPELYQYSFTLSDHYRLAKSLKETSYPWLLSYDDCEEIRKIYKWAEIKAIRFKYTIHKSRIKMELIIVPSEKLFERTNEMPDLFA